MFELVAAHAIGQVGEDVKSGDLVLRAGRKLRPQDVGLLASLGISPVEVVVRPKVALLVTGLHAALALVLYELGFRLGRWWQDRTPEEKEGPTGMLVGSVFALMAFLLAITLVALTDGVFTYLSKLIIDDAIVVLENIYRHIELGKRRREASAFATGEIGLAGAFEFGQVGQPRRPRLASMLLSELVSNGSRGVLPPELPRVDNIAVDGSVMVNFGVPLSSYTWLS